MQKNENSPQGVCAVALRRAQPDEHPPVKNYAKYRMARELLTRKWVFQRIVLSYSQNSLQQQSTCMKRNVYGDVNNNAGHGR